MYVVVLFIRRICNIMINPNAPDQNTDKPKTENLLEKSLAAAKAANMAEIYSDRNPTIVGDILSWNVLNKMTPSNNGLGLDFKDRILKEETNSEYSARLTRIAVKIAEMVKRNQIGVICLQEMPIDKKDQDVFLQALKSNLKDTDFDFDIGANFAKTEGSVSSRVILYNKNKYKIARDISVEPGSNPQYQGFVQTCHLSISKGEGERNAGALTRTISNVDADVLASRIDKDTIIQGLVKRGHTVVGDAISISDKDLVAGYEQQLGRKIPNRFNSEKRAWTTGWYNNCGLNCFAFFLIKKLVQGSESDREVFTKKDLSAADKDTSLLASFREYYKLGNDFDLKALKTLFENETFDPVTQEMMLAPVLRYHLTNKILLKSATVAKKNAEELWVPMSEESDKAGIGVGGAEVSKIKESGSNVMRDFEVFIKTPDEEFGTQEYLLASSEPSVLANLEKLIILRNQYREEVKKEKNSPKPIEILERKKYYDSIISNYKKGSNSIFFEGVALPDFEEYNKSPQTVNETINNILKPAKYANYLRALRRNPDPKDIEFNRFVNLLPYNIDESPRTDSSFLASRQIQAKDDYESFLAWKQHLTDPELTTYKDFIKRFEDGLQKSRKPENIEQEITRKIKIGREDDLNKKYSDLTKDYWLKTGYKQYAEYMGNMQNKQMCSTIELRELANEFGVGLSVFSMNNQYQILDDTRLNTKGRGKPDWNLKVANVGLHWEYEADSQVEQQFHQQHRKSRSATAEEMIQEVGKKVKALIPKPTIEVSKQASATVSERVVAKPAAAQSKTLQLASPITPLVYRASSDQIYNLIKTKSDKSNSSYDPLFDGVSCERIPSHNVSSAVSPAMPVANDELLITIRKPTKSEIQEAANPNKSSNNTTTSTIRHYYNDKNSTACATVTNPTEDAIRIAAHTFQQTKPTPPQLMMMDFCNDPDLAFKVAKIFKEEGSLSLIELHPDDVAAINKREDLRVDYQKLFQGMAPAPGVN